MPASPLGSVSSEPINCVRPDRAHAFSDFEPSILGPATCPLIGPPVRPGTIGTVGPYELLRNIGEGGMGVVFLAKPFQIRKPAFPRGTIQATVDGSSSACEEPSHLPGPASRERTFVALKILRPELARDPRAVEYFRKEALHMQRLEHESILRVLEFSRTPRGDYLVMPYMEGGSLDTLLKNRRPDEARAHRIALQLASALAFAHSRGIIHRDLKPRNVLMDSRGDCYLTDFGLAYSVDNDSLLEPDKLRIQGSLPYMSPKAACGEYEGTRADIYSFGALLYEVLTGRPPYVASSREKLLNQIRSGPPLGVRNVTPNAPAPLVNIVERAMRRELRERYADMSYVVTDLEQIRERRTESASAQFKICLNLNGGFGTTAVLFFRKLMSLRTTKASTLVRGTGAPRSPAARHSPTAAKYS